MKKFIALLVSLMLLAACTAALAEDTTYTIFYTTEELSGVTDMNGFVTGSAMTEMNFLTLKDDGAYELTKLLGTVSEEGEILESEMDGVTLRYEVRYVFTGTYAQDGDQVTLEIPEECVFSEDWGVLTEMGYMQNSEGSASNGDRVTNYEGTDYDPMDNFCSPYYKFAGHDTAIVVTVDAANGTFSYNEVANSDDD